MFDVLHVLYEEYVIVSSREELIMQSKVRAVIHEQLYGIPYRYGPSEDDVPQAGRDPSQTTTADGVGVASHVSSKSYVPPTEPSELSGIVGQPLG